MRVALLIGLAWLSLYRPDAIGDMTAGEDGAAVCDTTKKLKDLEKAVAKNDEQRADAEDCVYLLAGSRIVIIEDTGENLPLGGSIVKVRAFTEDGESFVGYTSRKLIVDKK